MRNITLITMGAGNVKVLEETLKSFSLFCNEVIYGNMLIFPEDHATVAGYEKAYKLKQVLLPFNYLYHNGFSDLLNLLASKATNDLVVYMNTSEVVGEDFGITEIVNANNNCNAFYFVHPTERHRWFRMYDRRELHWSGLIHEELIGDYRPYHKPIFSMKDLPKDMDNPFKAKVFDSLKECVYWNQLIKIVDNPEVLGATSEGWVSFAKENYQNMKERLSQKGNMPLSLELGDFEMFSKEIYYGAAIHGEKFQSSDLIAFQNDRKHLL